MKNDKSLLNIKLVKAVKSFLLFGLSFAALNAQGNTAAYCEGLGSHERQCCLLTIQLRSVQDDILAMRMGGEENTSNYLNLQQSHDQITAKLAMANGLKNLVDDYQNFQQRLLDPSREGASLNHLIDEVREETQTINRMHAVHASIEEIAGNEGLRTASSVEELRTRLSTTCSGAELSERSRVVCQGLGLGNSRENGAPQFESSEEFLGAFFEAYFYAGQGEPDQASRLQQVVEYREALGGAQNAAVVSRLVELTREQTPLPAQAQRAYFPDSLLASDLGSIDLLTNCLSEARILNRNNNEVICVEEKANFMQEVEARRVGYINTVMVDQTLRSLVPASINDSTNLRNAAELTNMQLNEIISSFASNAEEGRRFETALGGVQSALTSQLEIPNLATPRSQTSAVAVPQMTAQMREENFTFLKAEAVKMVEEQLNCSGERQFLEGSNGNLQVNRQKLSDCLKDLPSANALNAEIARLEAAKSGNHQEMHRFTQTNEFKEAQAFQNYLGHKVASTCQGPEVVLENLGVCRDSFGERRQVSRLADETGDIISEYHVSLANGSRSRPDEIALMSRFCVRNQQRYNTLCNEITGLYVATNDPTNDEREREAFIDYHRTTAVQRDIRTGEERRVNRTSTGMMFANAIGSSLVNNLGWGMNYWQTNQMMPISRDIAMAQKTQAYMQQQNWLYLQNSFHHPANFSGYGGFGGLIAPIGGGFGSPLFRPTVTGTQNISF